MAGSLTRQNCTSSERHPLGQRATECSIVPQLNLLCQSWWHWQGWVITGSDVQEFAERVSLSPRLRGEKTRLVIFPLQKFAGRTPARLGLVWCPKSQHHGTRQVLLWFLNGSVRRMPCYLQSVLVQSDQNETGKGLKMDVFWFWLIIVLLLVAVFAWPSWPYTREREFYRRDGGWRYAPSGAAFVALMIILLLFWLGMIAITLPWAVAPY